MHQASGASHRPGRLGLPLDSTVVRVSWPVPRRRGGCQRGSLLPSPLARHDGPVLPPDLPRAYRVYTPFSRLYRGAAPPLPPPEALPKGPEEGEIPREDPGLPLPEPGEEAALAGLRAFLEAKLAVSVEGTREKNKARMPLVAEIGRAHV